MSWTTTLLPQVNYFQWNPIFSHRTRFDSRSTRNESVRRRSGLSGRMHLPRHRRRLFWQRAHRNSAPATPLHHRTVLTNSLYLNVTGSCCFRLNFAFDFGFYLVALRFILLHWTWRRFLKNFFPVDRLLNDNEIGRIKADGVFRDLPNLVKVDLRRNRIATIEKNAFEGASALVELWVSLTKPCFN